MTTQLNRTVKRESVASVHSKGRRRPIIIELQPPGNLVGFRLHGTRRTYYLPTEWLFREAARQTINREKALKKAERELRRKANRARH